MKLVSHGSQGLKKGHFAVNIIKNVTVTASLTEHLGVTRGVKGVYPCMW